jgi:fatty acid CoA ligase FadD9
MNGSNDRRQRRTAELYANDLQVRDAIPLEEITAAIRQPGMPILRIVAAVMEGYADRPALGERAKELATDPRRAARRFACWRGST